MPLTHFKKAAVVGLGYVGLPTAVVFADAGLEIIGVDVDEATVESINYGKAHIVETNLDELLHSVVVNGLLRATTQMEPADAFLIAVPTPFKEGHQPDLKFVKAAAEAIAPVLKSGNLVVLESTTPVGTTERIGEWMAALRPDLTFPQRNSDVCDIHIAHCPERILPGKVLHEVVHNERVIGGMTSECSALAVKFYKIAVQAECHMTDARTAELCKLSENAFRDVNIAFANELSFVADHLGVDVWDLINLANKHPRVNILRPGTGVGGHCIAVDPWFIVASAPESTPLIRTGREINDYKPEWVADKVLKMLASSKGKTVGCLGLAYKPDIDDLRESPSTEVVRVLALDRDLEILVCEPLVETLPAVLAGMDVRKVDVHTALAADVVVCLTPHTVFRDHITTMLGHRWLFDACGLLS